MKMSIFSGFLCIQNIKSAWFFQWAHTFSKYDTAQNTVLKHKNRDKFMNKIFLKYCLCIYYATGEEYVKMLEYPEKKNKKL